MDKHSPPSGVPLALHFFWSAYGKGIAVLIPSINRIRIFIKDIGVYPCIEMKFRWWYDALTAKKAEWSSVMHRWSKTSILSSKRALDSTCQSPDFLRQGTSGLGSYSAGRRSNCGVSAQERRRKEKQEPHPRQKVQGTSNGWCWWSLVLIGHLMQLHTDFSTSLLRILGVLDACRITSMHMSDKRWEKCFSVNSVTPECSVKRLASTACFGQSLVPASSAELFCIGHIQFECRLFQASTPGDIIFLLANLQFRSACSSQRIAFNRRLLSWMQSRPLSSEISVFAVKWPKCPRNNSDITTKSMRLSYDSAAPLLAHNYSYARSYKFRRRLQITCYIFCKAKSEEKT